MSTALAVVGSRDLITSEDVEILKKSKFKGFSDSEVAYAVKISNHLKLNPLLNQIHFVKRGQAVTAQVAIDGFRLCGQRTGEYAGSDEAIFEYASMDANKKKPLKATVTVYRIVSGIRCSFTASARMDEYYQASGGQWDRMPHVMLAKCAEAQALRKAFPAELSDVYAKEEMDQADNSKAQDLQEKIQTNQEEAIIEVDHREVTEQQPPSLICGLCQSQNVMESRYHQNTVYCRDCKKTSPRQG